MNNKKLKALIKASDALSRAWLEVYQASNTENDGEFYEIRQELNNLELKMVYMIQDMKENKDQEHEE